MNDWAWFCKMLLLREVVVLFGIGPFEATAHSLGLLVFSILLTLKVESAINSSWQVLFVPLYISLFLDAYYNSILVTRMILYSIKEESNRFLSALHSILTVVRLAILVYVEIQIPSVLDRGVALDSIVTATSLVPPICLLFAYLTVRFFFLYRTVPIN